MKQTQRVRLTPTRLRDFGALPISPAPTPVPADVVNQSLPDVVDLSLVETQKQVVAGSVGKSSGACMALPSRPVASSGFPSFSLVRSFPDVPEKTPPTAWLNDEDYHYIGLQGRGEPVPTRGQGKASGGKQAKKMLGLVIRVGGTLLLTYLLLKSFAWDSLFDAVTQIQRGNLLVAIIVGVIGVVLSCYQWRSVLLAENIHFDLADLIDLYVVGIAFSHFLPTGMGGDAIKAMHVGRESGNSAGSASAVVMCRVTGFFAMVLIAVPVLLIWHDAFDKHLILWFVALALLVGTMIAVALLCAILLPRVSLRAGQARGAHSWLQRIVQHRLFASVLKVGNALYASLKRKRSVLVATLYGGLFWVSAVLNCYSYADAIGIHAPLHFYFLVVPFISLIAFLPISINGYGLRESAFVYAFSTVHVSPAHALLLALLLDAQGILFGLCGGVIYLVLGHKSMSHTT